MPDGILRTPNDLIQAGLAAEADRDALNRLAARYAIAIPPTLAALIAHPNDPIARQLLPHPDELITAPHELPDPTADDPHSPLPGLVHRYPDRVLIKPLLTCPLYCRFCFRREQVGLAKGQLTQSDMNAALAYIAARPEIREIILTGGDPLLLSPRRLKILLQQLQAIPHVEILRIHTRVPTATPERVTPGLAHSLTTEKPLYLLLHANHPSEFTPQAGTAIKRIQARTIPILGQSVLLRGVNDNSETLENLFRTMLRHKIKPYYLHHLDPAPGTARFHVPIEEGQALLATLRHRLTGLAWPTYVRETPGGQGKVPIAFASPPT